MRLSDGESGLAARTIKRRLASVSGLFNNLVLIEAVAANPVPWAWPPAGPWLRTWLSRPRNLVLIGIGVACLALDKIGDVRREGALLALGPSFGVLLLFAVCYLLSVPVAWLVMRHQLRRQDRSRAGQAG